MHWNSVADFLAMGGYAFYVWSSFAVTAGVLGLEMWLLRRARLNLKRRLRNERLAAAEEGVSP